MPRPVIALIATPALLTLPATATAAARKAPKTRSVLYVGNTWDGTADLPTPGCPEHVTPGQETRWLTNWSANELL